MQRIMKGKRTKGTVLVGRGTIDNERQKPQKSRNGYVCGALIFDVYDYFEKYAIVNSRKYFSV